MKQSLDSLLHDWITTKSSRMGKGSYGSVYLVRNGAGQYRALKESVPQPSYAKYLIGCTFDILREISALRLIRDPHVISLIQADVSYEPLLLPKHFRAPETHPKRDDETLAVNPYAYVLMEDGEENATSWRNTIRLRKDDTKTGLELLRSCFHLFLALRALHTQKLMHNDIKPENMIRTQTPDGINEFKLSDFGLATYPESFQWKNPIMFALSYRAPELLLNQRRANYSYPADIWAAAISMSFLIFGTATETKGKTGWNHGLAPFPLKGSLLETWEDLINLIGLPNETWVSIYIDQWIAGAPELLGKLKKQGFDANMNAEDRVVNFLQRLQKMYGKEKLEDLASMLGGSQVFLQVLDLLGKCLQYDPQARPTVTECLHHPCFEKVRSLPSERKCLASSTPSISKPSLQTPSLREVDVKFQGSSKPYQQFKHLRRFIFEKVSELLRRFQAQGIHRKDESASILSCAMNIFDRESPNFFGSQLLGHTPLSRTVMQQIATFAIACCWLAGKFLTVLGQIQCREIAMQFSHLCTLSDVLRFEAAIVNQQTFTFPRSFLSAGFSISSDLYSVLNLNLENQEDIANEMFSTLLKHTA